MKKEHIVKLKEIFNVIIISLIGCVGIVFCVLYVDNFDSGFFADYALALKAVSEGLITILIVFAVVFYRLDKQFVYKLFFIVIALISLAVLSLFFLNKWGLLDKIDSVDDLRLFISSNGKGATLIFLLIQFLQVVALPIPSFITVGAGVLLFGTLKGAVLSTIGIVLGSVFAFFIGRVFGYKVVKWLIGEDALNKGLKAIKGKDKVILTFMFLFPFFPDDVLCFVAGITTVSPLFFICMILITRTISVFASSFSLSGNLIPYDSWWGILLWIIFFAITFVLAYIVFKKGDSLEKLFHKKSENE